MQNGKPGLDPQAIAGRTEQANDEFAINGVQATALSFRGGVDIWYARIPAAATIHLVGGSADPADQDLTPAAVRHSARRPMNTHSQ